MDDKEVKGARSPSPASSVRYLRVLLLFVPLHAQFDK